MRADLFERLGAAIAAEETVALATVVAGGQIGSQMLIWPGGQTAGDLGTPRLNQRAAVFAERPLEEQASCRKTLAHGGASVDIFFEVLAPRPRLIVVGAVHVAIPLVHFAALLGFHTVVVDPRAAFATPERFAHADELVVEWPEEALARIGIHASTYLAVLSHDLKIDLPALRAGLRSSARYLGALGSKKTHAKRVEALREEGFTPEQIERIHAPIGLDLGGRRAEEIALSIVAQVLAARHGAAAGR